MNIYLIERAENAYIGYDEFDSAVVIADTEEQARLMHPDWEPSWSPERELEEFSDYAHDWEDSPAKVRVTLIGTAERPERRVICASFNAG